MDINYLQHNQISKIKWDRCINQSFNGIVYAYSWYLDIVSYEWDALVFGDYEVVMPLTTKSNYAINKIIQPEYTQQLGVFTSKKLDIEMVNAFLSAIPHKFKSVQIGLNAFNKVSHPKFNLRQGITYELDLIVPYKSLYVKFNKEVQQKIEQATRKKVSVMKNISLKDFLLLIKNSYGVPLTFKQQSIIQQLIPFCNNHNIGETYGSYNNRNELVAGAFFIKSHQKVICLLAACSTEGIEIGANFALFNFYIKENTEKNITLDFGTNYSFDSHNICKDFNAMPVSFFNVKKTRFLRFF